MGIEFKSSRVEAEFATLAVRNLRLYNIVEAAADFCEHEFKKPLVLTCILRTPEENAALYAQSKEPAWRPHTQWQGVDLRASIYADWEIKRLLSFLNNYHVWGGQRQCAVYHQIPGNVLHFHIQCPAAEDAQKSGAV